MVFYYITSKYIRQQRFHTVTSDYSKFFFIDCYQKQNSIIFSFLTKMICVEYFHTYIKKLVSSSIRYQNYNYLVGGLSFEILGNSDKSTQLLWSQSIGKITHRLCKFG